MNCSTFKKKLYDYLENNVVYDMKEAMEMHMEKCEACKHLYEEEKAMDDVFKEAFKIDTLNFTSSRTEIIKNIDKNKYSKNPFKKLGFHLRRNRMQYLSSAAVLIFGVYVAQYIGTFKNSSEPNPSHNISLRPEGSNKELAAKSEDTTKMAKTSEGENAINAADYDGENSNQDAVRKGMVAESFVAPDNVYIPKFEQQTAKFTDKLGFGTALKQSENKKYSVALDGKGIYAVEEGFASIYIIDNENKEARNINLINEDGKQNTPMFVEWVDNENLFVIIGGAYGTPNVGGDVYLLNINTLNTSSIYKTTNPREQVVSVSKEISKLIDGEKTLLLELRVYTGDDMNEYNMETRTINYREISDIAEPNTK